MTFRYGTYLPLNINLESLKSENYTSSSTEDVLSTNSGYIVGKYTATSSSNALSLSSRYVGQLCNSMQGGNTSSTGAWKNLQYTEDVNKKLQILTIGTDGEVYVIGDDYNQLTAQSSPYKVYQDAGFTVERYDSEVLNLTQYGDDSANQVRRKLGESLMQQKMMFGLQFSSVSPTLTINANSPDRAGVLSLNSPVTLGDKTVNSLVQDSVHFALENDGVITMAVGTVYTSFDYIYGEATTMRVQTLPKLYRVDRNNDGDIVNLEEITTIYKDKVTGVISYNETSTTGKTLLYDYNTMGRLCNAAASGRDVACMQSLFYFEIPVYAGEYVFGSTQVSQAITYLLYLDIGANAGSEGTEGDGENGGNKPDYDGEISGVYFVDSNGNPIVQFTNEDGTPGAAVAFDITTSNTNGTSVSFVGKDSTTVTVDKGQNTNTTVTLVEKKKEETDGS